MPLPAPLRRLRAARRPSRTLEKHPDDLPKRGLFTEPVRVDRILTPEPETQDDGTRRIVFVVEIRDADDRRCSDLAVEAQVTGPERSRTVSGTTDMMGRIRFRTTGPAGTYRIEVLDVAAGGLAFDPQAGETDAAVTLP